jgi:predicted ribosome quality control (RQC) complex YloA/Tae2 family protein
MKISLKLNKSLDENAQVFFKKAKKQRKKIPGAEIAIKNTEKKF